MQINKALDKQLKDSLSGFKTTEGGEAGATAAPGEEAEDFKKTIKKREFELLDMEVQELVEEVTERGEQLKENQTPENAHRYKQAMASFMKKALKLSRKVEVKRGKRSLSLSDLQKNDEKKHRIVEKIDERMDKLTEALVSRQEENIDVAGHVDQIKGLVIDLVSAIKEPAP